MTSFNTVRITAVTVILAGTTTVQGFSLTYLPQKPGAFPRGCMMAIKDRPKQLFYRSSEDDAASSNDKFPLNENCEKGDEGMGIISEELMTTTGLGNGIPFSCLPFAQLPWIIPTDQLEQLKVSDLRLACQQRQLPKSGIKAKLVERLRNWSAAESTRLVSKKQRRQMAKDLLKIDNDVLLRKQRNEMKIELKDADVLYKEAKRRDMNGDIEGAKEVLEELLELTPDDFRIGEEIYPFKYSS